MRILLVEDEKRMADFVTKGLKEERYVIDVAYKGEDAIFLVDINAYDLIILDLMLPDTNGLAICKHIRNKKMDTPILIITAKDSVRDKVKGLDFGADDYLTKPFSFDEFLARVRALLRRKRADKMSIFRVADLELNQLTHKVKRADREIDLTSKEYALLEYLIMNANEVVTRTMISEHVWNEEFDSLSNIIDVFVNHLRNKIDKDSDKPLIHTIHGTGYILKE
ncbi:MAG: response regulator transcription factor [Candidatus Omnitrophica bacterium]|nr:response regulator transcription factor [Candidatus Omnitrophota bacterium]